VPRLGKRAETPAGTPGFALLTEFAKAWKKYMDEVTRNKILALLDQHRNMTIATLRADGWPQATTVGYANEGLTLYFLCGPDSQKAVNLARDDRVSLTIDNDTPQVMEITGLSMAAHAQVVTDPKEAENALHLLMQKYPEQESSPLPMPRLDEVRIFRVTPVVISVLDYSKGFGHTDLVTC
jgi:PPOX class probable F420-dependent enzyme